jgi:hypothetical protein
MLKSFWSNYSRLWGLGLVLMLVVLPTTGVAASLGLGGATQAADNAISLRAYWEKVEHTQALLDDLTQEAAGERQAELYALAQEWEAITGVKLPTGQTIPVESSFLAAQLRAEPPDPAAINELLSTLLTTAPDWPPARHTLADLQVLAEILARSEFQWPVEQRSPLLLWLLGLLDRFLRWLSSLMPEMPEPVSTGVSYSSYIWVILVSLALLLIVAFIARSLLVDLVAQAEAEPEHGLDDEVLTAGTAFSRAQTLSKTGDYRTAVRYLYLSSLLHLDEQGLLSYNRSQTNREYLRTVAHLPRLASLLREVIEVFDRVWYGYQPLDEMTYQQYAAQVAELHRQ